MRLCGDLKFQNILYGKKSNFDYERARSKICRYVNMYISASYVNRKLFNTCFLEPRNMKQSFLGECCYVTPCRCFWLFHIWKVLTCLIENHFKRPNSTLTLLKLPSLSILELQQTTYFKSMTTSLQPYGEIVVYLWLRPFGLSRCHWQQMIDCNPEYQVIWIRFQKWKKEGDHIYVTVLSIWMDIVILHNFHTIVFTSTFKLYFCE